MMLLIAVETRRAGFDPGPLFGRYFFINSNVIFSIVPVNAFGDL